MSRQQLRAQRSRYMIQSTPKTAVHLDTFLPKNLLNNDSEETIDIKDYNLSQLEETIFELKKNRKRISDITNKKYSGDWNFSKKWDKECLTFTQIKLHNDGSCTLTYRLRTSHNHDSITNYAGIWYRNGSRSDQIMLRMVKTSKSIISSSSIEEGIFQLNHDNNLKPADTVFTNKIALNPKNHKEEVKVELIRLENSKN